MIYFDGSFAEFVIKCFYPDYNVVMDKQRNNLLKYVLVLLGIGKKTNVCTVQ